MKVLNVVDLDKTLVSVDSFRYLIFSNLNFKLLVLVILRKLKIISRDEFAKRAHRILNYLLLDEEAINKFVHFLTTKINKFVLQEVKNRSGAGQITIILSASPEEYVSRLANQLGFLGIGSHWQGERYFHCFGMNKIKYIKEKFPRKEYIYNFAISDSKQDEQLLHLFKTGFHLMGDELVQQVSKEQVNFK